MPGARPCREGKPVPMYVVTTAMTWDILILFGTSTKYYVGSVEERLSVMADIVPRFIALITSRSVDDFLPWSLLYACSAGSPCIIRPPFVYSFIHRFLRFFSYIARLKGRLSSSSCMYIMHVIDFHTNQSVIIRHYWLAGGVGGCCVRLFITMYDNRREESVVKAA